MDDILADAISIVFVAGSPLISRLPAEVGGGPVFDTMIENGLARRRSADHWNAIAACSVVLGLAVALASCESSTPTEPSVPTVAGIWNGGYQITQCTVNDEALCANRCRVIVGRQYKLRLTLQQSNSQAGGPLELNIEDPFSVWNGPVNGTVNPAGALQLAGTIPAVDRASGQVTGFVDVNWATMLDTGGSSMSGSFVQVERGVSAGGCIATETATITSLVRAPVASASTSMRVCPRAITSPTYWEGP